MKKNIQLKFGAKFSLFATSYLPLFLIMLIRQLFLHKEYLNYGGLNLDAIKMFIKYFGFVTFTSFITFIGIIGLIISIRTWEKETSVNGTPVELKEINNRNSEAISYIATYIIPFLFQDYSQIHEVLSMFILLLVIYMIYVNSNLILINPALNLFYSLYDVRFIDNLGSSNELIKSGMIITDKKILEEGSILSFKRIGQKLYFSLGGHE